MNISRSEEHANRSFAVDTTFVLFFLAVDLGQHLTGFGPDSVLSVLTLALLLALPYLLPAEGEKPEFMGWLAGRGVIATFGILLGSAFHASLGSVLPEAFRFLPMTFVVLTAMLSCYLQFYAIIRFRLAR